MSVYTKILSLALQDIFNGCRLMASLPIKPDAVPDSASDVMNRIIKTAEEMNALIMLAQANGEKALQGTPVTLNEVIAAINASAGKAASS